MQLESRADAGFVVVLLLMGVVTACACTAGLPALHDGSFAVAQLPSSGAPALHQHAGMCSVISKLQVRRI